MVSSPFLDLMGNIMVGALTILVVALCGTLTVICVKGALELWRNGL